MRAEADSVLVVVIETMVVVVVKEGLVVTEVVMVAMRVGLVVIEMLMVVLRPGLEQSSDADKDDGDNRVSQTSVPILMR